MTDARRGLTYGISAYLAWGIVPVYWKWMASVPPIEILAHRVTWGAVALITIVALHGASPKVRAALSDRRTVGMMALSGGLLAINWGVFIAAITAGRLLDASLGYFINPLVSVLLGTLILREQLRPLQRAAIGLALVGVAIGAWQVGHVPWISLVLAASFGSYGLVRKVARVDALAGSTIETVLLAPVAIGYLIFLAAHHDGGLGHAPSTLQGLLLSTGVVTVVPLLMFTAAARRLPLSTIGFLQYLTPTGQLILAVAVYDEPLAAGRLAAFVVIWIALAVFTVDLAINRSDR